MQLRGWLVATALFLPLLEVQAVRLDQPAASPDKLSKSVVFSADWTYRPFTFLDKDGQPSGFDVELFKNVAAEAGLKPVIELGEWNDSLLLLESRLVDVVPMFVTPTRAKRYLFSEPILRRYHLVFGRKGGRYVASLKELAHRRVAMQYSRLSWEEMHDHIPPVMIVPQSSEADAVLAVSRGEAEYALVPAIVGYDSITRHNLKDVVALSPPVLEGVYAYAIPHTRPELVAQINAALRRVQANGVHDELYIEWLANLKPPADSYRSGLMAGAWAAVPLMASTLLVYFWWRRARRHAALEYERAEAEARLRQDAQARMQYLAFHDPLTGLLNRNALQDQLEQCLQEAKKRGSRCTLARLDLMDLDLVLTVAGQSLCDEIVQLVAQRLVKNFGSDRVSHLGRGEFAVMLDEPHRLQDLHDTAKLLLTLAQERAQTGGFDHEPQCRVGLAQFPADADSATGLMRAAEMACAAAHKRNVRSMVYTPSLEPDPRNLTLLSDLRQAMRDGTLAYALQPKLSLTERKYSGAELLVRWNHPQYGALSPAEFVPLAEQTGLVGEMTLYLVQRALAHCREWEAQALDLTLSVNVSVNDLASQTLVHAIVEEAKNIGHRLMLEVTETDMMRDTEQVLAGIAQLRSCGIRISLDDFGTGHASLTYLQRMAPDELKIDRSFISNLRSSVSDQMIVRTSIQLAHDLGATVTAEGIEDAQTLEWLAQAGCDMAQGFLIARPMPPPELIRSPHLRWHS